MWTCCCPGAQYALRSKIRTAFRIEVVGYDDDDILLTVFVFLGQPL